MKNILLLILSLVLGVSSFCQGKPESYDNIVTYSTSGLSSLKIMTKIPTSNDHMPTVKVEGYSNGHPATIGLNIAWKVKGGGFENAAASSFGGIAPKIFISDVNGLVEIFIDTWADDIAVKVSAIDGGIGEDPAWFTDWSINGDPYDPGNQNITAELINRGGYGEFNSLYSGYYSGGTANITNITANNITSSWASFSSMEVKNKATTDQQQAYSIFTLTNRRAGGGDYKWSLMTGAVGGGWGVTPNGFDLYEYPGGGAGSCCIPRIIVHPSEKNGVLTNVTPFVINPNGAVLIGYSNASAELNNTYALAVKGNIKAKKLRITSATSEWPDYVFKSDYKLEPLSSVEFFIKKNKHLPDVPSAKKIEQEGIDVGETQAILLKKIEELTLYIINQDKAIKALQERIKKIEISSSKE